MHSNPFPRTDSIEIVEAPISVTPETRSFRDTTLYTLKGFLFLRPDSML